MHSVHVAKLERWVQLKILAHLRYGLIEEKAIEKLTQLKFSWFLLTMKIGIFLSIF
jgi:hypothetical protein